MATKGQLYTQSTHPIVQYTITINPKALDLIPEGAEQAFTLTDEIGPALRFEQDTLTVNGSAWDGGVEFAGNTMRIHGLKDETAYEIKYKARIVLDSGTDFDGDGWNQVDISPIEIPGSNDSSTELTGEVLEATAGGESSTLKVSIFKKDDSGDPVQGATFTLYSYGTGTEPDEGAKKEVATLVSGENGETAQFDVTFDTIYRLVETGVPAGYGQGDSELPYFVRPSKGSDKQYGANVQVLTGYQEYEFEVVNPKLKAGSLYAFDVAATSTSFFLCLSALALMCVGSVYRIAPPTSPFATHCRRIPLKISSSSCASGLIPYRYPTSSIRDSISGSMAGRPLPWQYSGAHRP